MSKIGQGHYNNENLRVKHYSANTPGINKPIPIRPMGVKILQFKSKTSVSSKPSKNLSELYNLVSLEPITIQPEEVIDDEIDDNTRPTPIEKDFNHRTGATLAGIG